MAKPKIVAYINPFCPWSPGVIRTLEQHGLEYEHKDVTRDRKAFEEMVEKSGQYSTPSVEIDGQMLADVGGDEVDAWLRQKGYVETSAAG